MRQIAIGEFSFETIIKNKSFYVDKTLFIKEYLTSLSPVTLITRPRRFGKSLTLDMLDRFLNINLDSKELFKDLNIEKHPKIVDKYMNKYPVIHLDFKGMAEDNLEKFIENFISRISKVYSNYEEICGKPSLIGKDIVMYNNIINSTMTNSDILESLKLLTELIYKHYKIKPIVIIDEYDMPLEKAYANGYYKEAVNIISPFLGNALKGNEYLEKALLVGCSKVAQAGIFSGLNNLYVCTLLTKQYNEYFGFTEDEVKEALEEYKLNDKFGEVKYWYDGYNIGGISIYNPWSITNYLYEQEFKPYWVNTGSNLFIKELLKVTNYNTILKPLVNGKFIEASYTEQIEYNDTVLDKDAAISLLFQAGYLKMTEMNLFKLVNKEVYDTFERTFSSCIKNDSRVNISEKTFFDNLITLNIKEAEDNFKQLIEKAVYTDKESYYYAILDRCSYVILDRYIAQREQLSNKGRSDFILKNKANLNNAYVIEVKKINVDKQELINKVIIEALEQIEEKKYYKSLEIEGYRHIHKIALVINGDEVYIRFKNNFEYEELYSQIPDFIV